MSPLTQSRAVDDAPSEDERQEEELPSHVAALGSASRAHLTAASYSKHPSLTPSSHSSANLIAGIITCFNKQISDGKEHEMFFFFFHLEQHQRGRTFNEFTAGNKQIKKSVGSFKKNLFFSAR